MARSRAGNRGWLSGTSSGRTSARCRVQEDPDDYDEDEDDLEEDDEDDGEDDEDEEEETWQVDFQ